MQNAKSAKMPLILAMLVLAVGAVSAAELDIETGFTSIGVSVSGSDTITINETGGELNFVACGDRFTGKVSFSAAALNNVEGLPNLSGTFIDFGVGFGPTFIKTEKISFSLMGVLGIQGDSGAGYQKYYYNYDISNDTYTSFYDFNAGLFYIGPELKFTVTPSSRVGFYTDFGIYYTCGNADAKGRFVDNSPYHLETRYWSGTDKLKGAIARLSIGLKIRLV